MKIPANNQVLLCLMMPLLFLWLSHTVITGVRKVYWVLKQFILQKSERYYMTYTLGDFFTIATVNGKTTLYFTISESIAQSLYTNEWFLHVSLTLLEVALSGLKKRYAWSMISYHKAYWCPIVTRICVNIGSGRSLLPDSTKPLPEPMLTEHQRCYVVFTWEKLHRKCSWT